MIAMVMATTRLHEHAPLSLPAKLVNAKLALARDLRTAGLTGFVVPGTKHDVEFVYRLRD